jgi:hypothetical protein
MTKTIPPPLTEKAQDAMTAAAIDGFALHGIDHTSPSQINLVANEPAMWVMEYLLGRKVPRGARAARGVAVETAVVAVLRDAQGEDEAIEGAIREYNRTTALMGGPHREQERQVIAPMVRLALHELQPLGVPDFPAGESQHKIEITCRGDGWTLPVIGYLDFVYPDQGLVVDLKTTHRMPSVMSREHQRQRCIYQRAMGNHGVRFLYVTGKKAEWREDGEVDDVLAEVKTILNRWERFLRLSPDPKILTSAVPIIPGSFYWNNPAALQARQEVFGF